MATSGDRGLPIGDRRVSATSDLSYAVARLLFDCGHVGVRSQESGDFSQPLQDVEMCLRLSRDRQGRRSLLISDLVCIVCDVVWDHRPDNASESGIHRDTLRETAGC